MGSTRVGKTIYLHLMPGVEGAVAPGAEAVAPPARSVVVPEFPGGPKLLRARVLGAGGDLSMRRAQEGGMRVELRGATLGDPTVIVELTYEGSVMELPLRH